MTFAETMNCYTEQIVRALAEYVTPAQQTSYSVIYDAVSYSAMAGGKRIRPVIVLAFCEMLGGLPAQALPLACALEMVHTYSLVHDDLPCMDNDDLRRGKPTSHKVYGEALAVLSGDALLTKAFSVIADAAQLSAECRLRSAAYLASAAGMDGMIGGQVLDMNAEHKALSLDALTELQALKTGKLLCAAAVLGCYAAEVYDDKAIAAAEAFGKNLGLAFQIEDDILDVEGEQKALGKTIGKDEKSGKSTFVSLLGLDACKERVQALTQRAISTLPQTDDGAFLRSLAEMLMHRTN